MKIFVTFGIAPVPHWPIAPLSATAYGIRASRLRRADRRSPEGDRSDAADAADAGATSGGRPARSPRGGTARRDLLEARAVAVRAGCAPSQSALHARLRGTVVYGFRRTPWRSALCRRQGDRDGTRELSRPSR